MPETSALPQTPPGADNPRVIESDPGGTTVSIMVWAAREVMDRMRPGKLGKNREGRRR